VGLFLATPLTVCVVVIGHHVPNLGFISVLLSDEEVLPPKTRFYQRMLAMDLEEATEVAEEFLKSGKPLEQLFDEVIIPALSLAEQDRHRGRLDDVREQYIFQNTRILIEDITERVEELSVGSGSKHQVSKTGPDELPEKTRDAQAPVAVLCIPARDEADDLGAFMMTQLLIKRGIVAKALASGGLTSESVQALERERPEVVFVSVIPPFGYMHARYLCRRIRAQFQGAKLVCGMLTEEDVNEVRQRQPPIPADELASSLQQAQAQVISLIPVRNNQSAPAAAIAS
jgi:hypothetical protein